MDRIPVRTWFDTWEPAFLGYSKSGCCLYESRFDVAKTLYPYVDIRRGLRGLETSSWQDQLVNRIIDLEPDWDFSRADWFIMNHTLFLTSEETAVMFKLMTS